MSYTCGICKKAQPEGSRPEKVITKRHPGGKQIKEERDTCPECLVLWNKMTGIHNDIVKTFAELKHI